MSEIRFQDSWGRVCSCLFWPVLSGRYIDHQFSRPNHRVSFHNSENQFSGAWVDAVSVWKFLHIAVQNKTQVSSRRRQRLSTFSNTTWSCWSSAKAAQNSCPKCHLCPQWDISSHLKSVRSEDCGIHPGPASGLHCECARLKRPFHMGFWTILWRLTEFWKGIIFVKNRWKMH